MDFRFRLATDDMDFRFRLATSQQQNLSRKFPKFVKKETTLYNQSDAQLLTIER